MVVQLRRVGGGLRDGPPAGRGAEDGILKERTREDGLWKRQSRAEQSEQIIKQVIIENTRIEQLLFHLPTNKDFRNNHNTWFTPSTRPILSLPPQTHISPKPPNHLHSPGESNQIIHPSTNLR